MKKVLLCCMLALMISVFALISCDTAVQEKTKDTETAPEILREVEKAKPYIEENYADENMKSVTIEARGNSIVYIFTTDISKEDIKIAANAVEDRVLEALETAKKELPMLESYIYEYYDINGELLYSMEYKPEV